MCYQELYIYFKNTKKPVYSQSTNPCKAILLEYIPTFKMFPPFASNEGYSASGLRYQSDGVRVTHPLPHSEFTRIRERMCDLSLTLSFSFCLLFLYLIIFTLNYSFCSVIITLWSSCTYFTAVSDGCWRINTSIGFPRHSLSSVNGGQVQPRKSSKMVWHICIHHTPGFSVVLYFSHILLVI